MGKLRLVLLWNFLHPAFDFIFFLPLIIYILVLSLIVVSLSQSRRDGKPSDAIVYKQFKGQHDYYQDLLNMIKE